LRLPVQVVDETLDNDVAFFADRDGLDLALTDQFIDLVRPTPLSRQNGPIGAVI
jgi:hypothetical protein